MHDDKFEIRSSPPSEEHGGPPESGPDAFVQTGGYGVLGEYVFDGTLVVLALEGAQSLDDALSALRDAGGRELTVEQIRNDGDASYGALAVEPQDDGTLHVEYQPFYHRGRDVDISQLPVVDPDLQEAIEDHFRRNEAALLRFVDEHAGEMR